MNDEVELKSTVPDLSAARRRLEQAGARLMLEGRLEDRRYDDAARTLMLQDHVLRVRTFRDGDGARATVDWKGPTRFEGGYKVREEISTTAADADVMARILERLGYEVIREIDRDVVQYELDGCVVRFESYPRLDVLVEVEGTPDGIERAIAALGLPREGFSTDRLLAFAQRFEARTGQRAAVSFRELHGDYEQRLVEEAGVSERGREVRWDAADAVAVDANAIVHGGELVGPASLTLLPDRVVLASASHESPRRTGRLMVLELPFASLEGASVRAEGLTLYLGDGDLVELAPLDGEQETLARAGDALLERASHLPELTISLRALGSRGAGAEHDEFFGPLLRARAAAERATDPLQRVAAVDAPVLRARLQDAVRAAAARRAPSSPPDRRALEAELGDCVRPLGEALEQLAALADAVRVAADDVRLARWREWAAGLARVFARADGCWESSLPTLGRETRLSRRRSVASRLWRTLRDGP